MALEIQTQGPSGLLTPPGGDSNVNPKLNGKAPPTSLPSNHTGNTWLYPLELVDELRDYPGITPAAIQEALSVAWEYSRCIIPVYTNWSRYVAFMKIILIGTFAEYHGSLFDILTTGDSDVLGYDLSALFQTLFGGLPPPQRQAMEREYRAFLLTTTEKTRNDKGGQSRSLLFHRYVESLSSSPKTWFRLRDADALLRFSIAAALACNDLDRVYVSLSEQQLQILGEVACTLYDAVAFYKHRAEGEVSSTFAYVDPRVREAAFKRARKVLWALDVCWAKDWTHRLPIVNLVRPFGGPIHMMMRRYRFVEDGLTVGKVEDEGVVGLVRKHFKLWNRVEGGDDGDGKADEIDRESYRAALEQKERVLFEGLAEVLERQGPDSERCRHCQYRESYGARAIGEFGGVELCNEHRENFVAYVESLPRRAAEAFPEIRQTQLKVD